MGFILKFKGRSTIGVYIALLLLDVGLMFVVVLKVVPMILPLMSEGQLWLLWPTIGLLGGLIAAMITYVVQKRTSSEVGHWTEAISLAAIFFICVTCLAFIFDRILPLRFEPFRSLVIPAMIFTIFFVIVARIKYPRKTRSPL